MKQREQDRVNEYKNEYKAYLLQEDRLKELNDKIEVLDNQFNAHSPALSSAHITGKTRDQRLAEYLTRKSKLEKERSHIEAMRNRIEDVEQYMSSDYIIHLRNICKGIYTQDYAADKMHMSRRAFQLAMDKEILKAIKANYD